MKKRLLSLFLIMLLLSTVFVGCASNNEPPTDSDTEQTSSQVDTGSGETNVSKTTGSEPETMNTEDITSAETTNPEEHKLPESESSVLQEEKPTVEINKTETNSTKPSVSATPTAETTTPPAQTVKPETTKPPIQQTVKPETTKPSTQSTEKSEESKQPVTAEPPKPAEPTILPEKPVVPEFNIQTWIDFAKSYAIEIGLELSPTAVECWDNPIIASANSKYIERDITDCLNFYKDVEGFTGVWIWAESNGNGAYTLYIGYE